MNVAIPWKDIDPNINNPVSNTKSEYLKFLNTAVFSEEARHFLRNGYYTNAPYGSKDYNDYWDEQEKRCLEGYSVGGVRITGRHYYYLNFTLMKARPIDPNTGIEHIEGKKELTFPRFLDHQYYLFNEIEECMAEGPHIGKDRYGLVILKSRRKGLTYCISNGLYGYNFTFIPASTNILGAYEKQHYKVTLDGIHFGLNHINKHTDWAKRRQKLNKRDHFRASFMYKDSNGVEIEDGYMSEIMALSFKDNEFKSVGDCFKPNQMILNSLGESVRIDSIKVGDYVMGIDGSPRKVLNVHSGTDLMTTYEQNSGVSFTVNTTHKHYGKLSSGSSFFTISSKDFLNRGASFRNDFKIFKSTGKEIVPDSGTTIYPVNNYYGEYVGIEVDGDHLFLLDDFTIVHNSASIFGVEEAGKFNNLITTYPISIEPLVRDGDVTTGFPIIYGSAGDMEGGSIGLAEMFYNPKAYGLKSYENIYDENATGDCGYFIDDLWYLPGKYKKPVSINGKKVEKSFDMVDKEGNSIRDVALESLTEKRVLRKKGNKDAYLKFLSQQPLNPREALLRTQGNMFDAVRAQFRLSQIETNPAIYIDSIYRCNLTVVPDTGEIKMEINNNVQPVYEFPIKDNKNKPGIIEIYELPVKNIDGKVPYGLYIFAIDSFDDDASTTDSMGSMLVFNRLTQRIVAHYKGRPMANQFYENCRRLAKFYNARGVYERRNKGIYGYFLNTGSLHLLAEEPEILREKGISKANTLGNNSLGIAPSTSVNAYGRELALKWMSSLAYNEEPNSEITNLDKIRSIPLLKEIIAWNSDGNFDDISALGLLMIYAEDRSVIKVDPDRKIEVKSTNNFWDKLNTNKYNKKDYSFTYN